MNVILKN